MEMEEVWEPFRLIIMKVNNQAMSLRLSTQVRAPNFLFLTLAGGRPRGAESPSCFSIW